MLPLSLYIHIPWCIRKCPYCDFNSHKSPDTLPEDQYIQALLDDLDQERLTRPPRALSSIFIGGGTPSLLSVNAYQTLFSGLQQRLTFKPNIEITLEANPGTIDEARFEGYRSIGINRLSLGIQSFNANHLSALGRIHDDKQAHLAIEKARRAGFDNINLDLMHGLPNQSIKEGLDDLNTALAYAPEHLSWYQLTIEPNTFFYKHPPTLPSDDACSDLEDAGFEVLTTKGYTRYEISAFCQPEKASKHNLNYWLFGDYYGIGAGAHGKWTSPTDNIIYRTQKHRQPSDYLNPNKPFLTTLEKPSKHDIVLEYMLNTTRLEQPIPHTLFTERTGLPLTALMPDLIHARDKGLIHLSDVCWQVTALGRRYTNDLQTLFLATAG